MAFEIFGPVTQISVYEASDTLFLLPKRYSLDCPVLQQLHRAYQYLQNVQFDWHSDELDKLINELSDLQLAYQYDPQIEDQELTQLIEQTLKLCLEVKHYRADFLFCWG